MIEIKPGTLEEMLAIESAIPEFSNPKQRADLEARLTNRRFLLLVAYEDSQPVGYKLGYELNDNEFYSWLGAVLSSHRGKGLAKQMLVEQERWCRAQGYHAIRVKSMNRFKNMLLMLISNNYRIVECEAVVARNDHKIHFYKSLI
ncbi:GNAT family N-acetyltransferase (plasmid) [Pseudoalteromonas sp. T1lg65]|uniref:GNAT family N-acetyltransferase n=1 Tax=Pseudoalteromonas sp. T1lg65 TaxID=2077101 RepID=UPI003F7A3E6D